MLIEAGSRAEETQFSTLSLMLVKATQVSEILTMSACIGVPFHHLGQRRGMGVFRLGCRASAEAWRDHGVARSGGAGSFDSPAATVVAQ